MTDQLTSPVRYFKLVLSRALLAGLLFNVAACCCTQKPSPSITAVGLSPGNRCEPEGIPYYLPKPLLVIAKNFRHIDESKVGLTNPAPVPNAFDNQSSFADVKANVTVPGGTGLDAADVPANRLPSQFDTHRDDLPDYREQMTPSSRLADGIAPDCFYTYQIIFVPDLTQKYGLRISGGAGEIRAAMNLVNGWMYTGMGPYYMKDSSSAQNMMAAGVGAMYAGRGVSDVLNEVGELASIGGAGTRGGAGINERGKSLEANTLIDRATSLAKALQTEAPVPQTMLNYAEITIYEPIVSPEGDSEWRLVAQHSFDRQYFQPGMNDEGLKLFGQILKADQAERKENAKSEAAKQGETAPPKPDGERENLGPEEVELPLGMRNESLKDDFKRQILLDSPMSRSRAFDRAEEPVASQSSQQVNVNVGKPFLRRPFVDGEKERCSLLPRLFARPTSTQTNKVGSALELVELPFQPAAFDSTNSSPGNFPSQDSDEGF